MNTDIYWSNTTSNDSWTYKLKDVLINNITHVFEHISATIDSSIENIQVTNTMFNIIYNIIKNKVENEYIHVSSRMV